MTLEGIDLDLLYLGTKPASVGRISSTMSSVNSALAMCRIVFLCVQLTPSIVGECGLCCDFDCRNTSGEHRRMSPLVCNSHFERTMFPRINKTRVIRMFETHNNRNQFSLGALRRKVCGIQLLIRLMSHRAGVRE